MPRNNSKARREQRKTKSKARQSEREARNPLEQALAIASRPGESKRERARLGLGEAARERKHRKSS